MIGTTFESAAKQLLEMADGDQVYAAGDLWPVRPGANECIFERRWYPDRSPGMVVKQVTYGIGAPPPRETQGGNVFGHERAYNRCGNFRANWRRQHPSHLPLQPRIFE